MNVNDLVRKAGLSGNYGGITFASASFAPALDGVHFLYDETAGFSALMNMFDRNPAAKLEERTWAGNKQWTMWAPMLALRMPDPAAGFPSGTELEPMIFLRNATAKKASASITLSWRGDSGRGQVTLPQVSLRPFETRQLEIDPMQKQLGIPDDAHWALVTLTSPASPDDLMAVAASYDSTGRYGAQTPFSDNLGPYWSGGQWQVDATHNAIIAVTNGGNRATDALLTLHFEDGKKNYEIQQTIQSGEQMWLNLADVIHHSAPDRKGNSLSSDVTSGTYDLEDLNPGLGGNLIEGKVVLDKTWGHLTYGCLTCCGYTPYLSPDPTGVGLGGDAGISALGTNNCTGVNGFSLHSDFSQTNARWWSGNTSIATVTSFNGHGVAPGTTNGYASAMVLSGDGGRPKPPCPDPTQQGQNNMSVQPTITGPNTLWWFNGLSLGVSGYSNQITLTATASGSAYQWSIQVGSDKVQMQGSGQTSTVQLTSIGQSSTVNDVSIVVTVGGVSSVPFKITVRAPYRLIPDPNVQNPILYYSDTTYAWYTDIYYQILDNFGSPPPVVLPVMETFGSVVEDYSGTNWQPGPAECLPDTNADLTFHDHIGGERTGRIPTPVYNPGWTGVAVQHWSQDWRVGTCVPASGPRVQSDTIQKWTDHGLHTGIVSPNP